MRTLQGLNSSSVKRLLEVNLEEKIKEIKEYKFGPFYLEYIPGLENHYYGNPQINIRCPLPDHPDTNPSFSLNIDHGASICFSGCNPGYEDKVGFSATSFLMKFEDHGSYAETQKYIEKKFKIDFPNFKKEDFNEKIPFLLSVFIGYNYLHPDHRKLIYWKKHFWEREDGHCIRIDRDEISKKLVRSVNDFDPTIDKLLTQYRVKEMLFKLETKCYVASNIEPPYWIGEVPKWHTPKDEMEPNIFNFEQYIIFKDYILNLETNRINETTPSLFNITSIHNYYPGNENEITMKCPKWIKFLNQSLTEGNIRLLRQWFGYCLSQSVNYDKFLLLLGESNTGKTTVLNIMKKMLGKNNVTSVPLTDFGKRFALSDTIGKMLNVSGESVFTGKSSIEILKSFVSGEAIQMEKKYEHAASIIPTAKLAFGCNEFPGFKDKTDSIWNRIILIPFDNVVSDEDINRNLYNELCKEIDDIMFWALEGLRDLRKQEQKGFTIPEENKTKLKEHQLQANPEKFFVLKYIKEDVTSYVTRDEVQNKFNEYCGENFCEYSINHAILGKTIKGMYPHVVPKRYTDADGHRKWKYNGIAFK